MGRVLSICLEVLVTRFKLICNSHSRDTAADVRIVEQQHFCCCPKSKMPTVKTNYNDTNLHLVETARLHSVAGNFFSV